MAPSPSRSAKGLALHVMQLAHLLRLQVEYFFELHTASAGNYDRNYEREAPAIASANGRLARESCAALSCCFGVHTRRFLIQRPSGSQSFAPCHGPPQLRLSDSVELYLRCGEGKTPSRPTPHLQCFTLLLYTCGGRSQQHPGFGKRNFQLLTPEMGKSQR